MKFTKRKNVLTGGSAFFVVIIFRDTKSRDLAAKTLKKWNSFLLEPTNSGEAKLTDSRAMGLWTDAGRTDGRDFEKCVFQILSHKLNPLKTRQKESKSHKTPAVPRPSNIRGWRTLTTSFKTAQL